MTYPIPTTKLMLIALVLILGVMPAAFAQAAPVCGIPGTPACTPTPRPTDRPITASTAVPTALPTFEPTSTEAPLIALPLTGPCVVAPAGNFRVNVRDWPDGTGAITGVLTPDDAVEALARMKLSESSETWIEFADGSFVSERALRFGGEDCDDLPEIEIPTDESPFVLSQDTDEDGEPDVQLILRAPRSDETTDDVCIIYNYRDPYGSSGEICLALDISGSAVVCTGGHCIVVEETAAKFEPEFYIADGVIVPPVDKDVFQNSNLFILFSIAPELTGDAHQAYIDPDVCIEYEIADPHKHETEIRCIGADLSSGDVYCQDGHCVSVLD